MNKPEPISLNMSVLLLLEKWPETAPVFLKYRMACVGCSMSTFETLSDALHIYKLDADLFLKDLNQAVENPS